MKCTVSRERKKEREKERKRERMNAGRNRSPGHCRPPDVVCRIGANR